MIAATEISVAVGAKLLLDKVSVSLQAGEVLAILGPNGAGKSTLLQCLAGGRSDYQGSVRLADREIGELSLAQLATSRAVLSQSNPISFPFTALEIVLMGRHPYHKRKLPQQDESIARAALDFFDAGGLAERSIVNLSGGEQQRVHLARVLAQLWEQEHTCLLLDEPTSALDLKHQHQCLSRLGQLARRLQLSIAIVIHDLHLALRYTDRALLLKNGATTALGPTHQTLSPHNISTVFEIDSELVFEV